MRVVCEGESGGERDTPPSLLEIKGAQAARVDGDVGPPLQTGALLAPLQPSRMTSTEPDSLLSRLQNLEVEHERKGPVSSAPPSGGKSHDSSRCLVLLRKSPLMEAERAQLVKRLKKKLCLKLTISSYAISKTTLKLKVNLN